MALYPKALLKLIPPGPQDPRITARLAILHVAVSESDSLYDYFNGRSGGVESHFYIRYDGTVEQYRDTAYEADANMSANPFAISIETEGEGPGEWTDAQLASIKSLLEWIVANHDVTFEVPATWDGRGIGYHILFMDEWAGGPRSCPGPDRIKQFNAVLVPWFKAQASQPHTTNPPASPLPPVLTKPAPKPAPQKALNVKLIDLRDVNPYVTGPGVKPLQRLLGVKADGLGGPGTRAALGAAQKRARVTVDYIFGPDTAEALLAGK